MHRSGTTLLTSLVQACGVFMGNPLTENLESVLFQSVNRDLLDALGCGWRTLDYLPTVQELATCAARLAPHVRTRLEKEMGQSFWRRRLTTRKPQRWGWKDPRASVLLPVWYAVFPDATIVHAFRDGRRVARSLYERDVQTLGSAGLLDRPALRTRFRKDVELWENYERRIRQSLPLFDNHVSIRYESLLASPRLEIMRLTRTLELDASAALEFIERSIDRGRDERPWPDWTAGIVDDNPLLSELGYSTRPEREA